MAMHSFTIDEASISIYPVDANGNPVTDTPVWLSACADGIQLEESLEEIEDRPSGEPYPEHHHGAEVHRISIDHLWEMDLPLVPIPANLSVQLAATDIGEPLPAQNGKDYKLRPNQEYVMTIVWEDERDSKRFGFRTYFGVKDISREIAGRTDSESSSRFAFRAKYYLA